MLILFNFLFMWLYLFPFLSQDGEERYRIVNLYENVQTIMIDNSEKKVNDTFSERPHIVWGQNKAMRVRDIKTGRIYLVTAKTLDVLVGHKMSNYGPVFEETAVNSDGNVVAEVQQWYFLSYEVNGRTETRMLENGASLEGLPEKIALYHHSKDAGDRLVVSDFRNLLASLRQTDKEVKGIISGVRYKKGEEFTMRRDYMIMMYEYVNPLYSALRYTYQDLKLFLSVK